MDRKISLEAAIAAIQHADLFRSDVNQEWLSLQLYSQKVLHSINECGLDAICKAIEEDRNNFDIVIRIFKSDPAYEYIGEKLEKEYEKKFSQMQEKAPAISDNFQTALKKQYCELEYPAITDTIPKSFHDLLLLDMNSLAPVTISSIADKLPNSKYTLICGENGSGKCTFLCHLAKEWAMDHILNEFKHVFLMLETELPPELKQIIESKEDCLILLLVYGLSWKSYTAEYFRTVILEAQKQSNVKVLFACDLELQLEIRISYDNHYQIVGFSPSGLQKFTDLCFKNDERKFSEWSAWISKFPFIAALCFRPLYCAMLIHLFKSNRRNTVFNFTSFYKEFLISIIGQNTIKPVDSLSELTGKDMQSFEKILHFSGEYVKYPLLHSKNFPQWNVPQNSLGLLMKQSSSCFPPVQFCHSSLVVFMAMLASINDSYGRGYSEIYASQSSSGLLSIFSTGLRCTGCDSSVLSIFQAFESQLNNSQGMMHVDNVGLRKHELFDPIALFVYGWCLNNAHNNSMLRIPLWPNDEVRQTAEDWIFRASLHPPTTWSPYVVQTVTGDEEMWECIKGPQVKNSLVHTLHICGDLADFNGYSLEALFPHVKILKIKCNKWNKLLDSALSLKYLESLTISSSIVPSSVPSKFPLLLKSTSSLQHLTIKRQSGDFLETAVGIFSQEPLFSSLRSISFSHSSITSSCFECLVAFLEIEDSQLDMVIFKKCLHMDQSGLLLFLECFMRKKLQTIRIFGEGIISNDTIVEISKVINLHLPAICTKKELELDDNSISGSAVHLLASAVSSQKANNAMNKLLLTLPHKYKYDFHDFQNVQFAKETRTDVKSSGTKRRTEEPSEDAQNAKRKCQ